MHEFLVISERKVFKTEWGPRNLAWTITENTWEYFMIFFVKISGESSVFLSENFTMTDTFLSISQRFNFMKHSQTALFRGKAQIRATEV